MTVLDPIAMPASADGKLTFIASAFIVEEDKEIAWEGAKDHIRIRPDIGWIVSRYVAASTPESPHYNRNGHRFELADLQDAHKMIADTPLNIMHRSKEIVGHYKASEIVYPTLMQAGDLGGPHVQALATFYRLVHPRMWEKVQAAHERGTLWVSMEAYPETVTCMVDGCCGETYPFQGAYSSTYCKPLQKAGPPRILNNPLFVGGALVLPPGAPGWADAETLEVAQFIETHGDEAAALYEQIADQSPHLGPDEWEDAMFLLLASSGLAEGLEAPSREAFPVVPDSTNGGSFTVTPDPYDAPVDAAAGPPSRGAMIAFVPPPEIAETLTQYGTEPASEMHVTLAYLGQVDEDGTLPGPQGPVSLDEAVNAVHLFAAQSAPLPSAKVSGIGRFVQPDGGEVTYAPIDAPGLNEFRAALVQTLDAAGVPHSRLHGFSPHLTLSWSDGPMDTPPLLEWPVTEIGVWWAGTRTMIPLGSGD